MKQALLASTSISPLEGELLTHPGEFARERRDALRSIKRLMGAAFVDALFDLDLLYGDGTGRPSGLLSGELEFIGADFGSQASWSSESVIRDGRLIYSTVIPPSA